MSEGNKPGILADADRALYRWPSGYGSIVGRLHVHSDHGCADGVIAVEEGEGIDVEIDTPPGSYTHIAAAKDMALVVNMCADGDHPFAFPDKGEVEFVGGEDTILGPAFHIGTGEDMIEARIRHGHVSTVTRHDSMATTITHCVLSCVTLRSHPDRVVFTNMSRTIRSPASGGIDAHQTISINYTSLDDLTVPAGVRVITYDNDGITSWEAMWLEPGCLDIPDDVGHLTR